MGECGEGIYQQCWFKFLARWFPWMTWMQTYKLHNLRGDIIAGITCGLLIIPQVNPHIRDGSKTLALNCPKYSRPKFYSEAKI